MPTVIAYGQILACPGYLFGTDGSFWTRFVGRGRGCRLGSEWRQLAPSPRNFGRLGVCIRDQDRRKIYKLLHIAILEVFRGLCPEGLEGCHNDGNPLNCWLDNLRWDTPKNNAKDKVRHGTHPVGEKNSCTHLTDSQALEIRLRKRSGEKAEVLMREFDVGMTTVYDIASGRKWLHVGGFE